MRSQMYENAIRKVLKCDPKRYYNGILSYTKFYQNGLQKANEFVNFSRSDNLTDASKCRAAYLSSTTARCI